MSAPAVLAAGDDGDAVRIDVRLVVAPAHGLFHATAVDAFTAEGEVVRRGDVLGHVRGPGAEVPVAAFCDGFLVRVLASDGERVRTGQPLAWLHPFDGLSS